MAMQRLRFQYEVGLSPPLVVDSSEDGRLRSITPISSSPFLERSTDRRVIELNADKDLQHELLNNPGNVPTKLTCYIDNYVQDFDYTLGEYVASSASEFGALSPSRTISLSNLPAGSVLRLLDTNLLASSFQLSYRVKGSVAFVSIPKGSLPFTFPADTEALRYRFKVPPTAGMWSYYGISIADVVRYFSVGTNPASTADTLNVEVDDSVTITEPFGDDTSDVLFSYDYADSNDEGSLSLERSGDDYSVTALDDGNVGVYVNAHPTDMSLVPGRRYVDQTFTPLRTGYAYKGNQSPYTLPTTGFVVVRVNGVRIGTADIAALRRQNPWRGPTARVDIYVPYRAVAIESGGVTHYISRPGANEWAYGNDQPPGESYHVVIEDVAQRPMGERKRYDFNVTHKVTADQLIGGNQYNLPRVPLESGQAFSLNLTGYLGNVSHTPTAVVSDSTYLSSSISRSVTGGVTEFHLRIAGRGTPSANGEDEKVTISQNDADGNTLTFDVPVRVLPAVTGSRTGTIAGLYDVNDLSNLIRLPKGIISYQIDLSKYDWEAENEDIDSIDASTFTLLASSDSSLATATLTNNSIVTISTDTGSVAEGAVSFQISVEDGEDVSINLLIPNIKGDTPLPYPTREGDFSFYEYVTDPPIPDANLAEPTGPRVEGNRLILFEQYGYLGEVKINEREQLEINEITFLDTSLKQKTLGSLFVDDGDLFNLPGQLANENVVVNWPSQWVEVSE